MLPRSMGGVTPTSTADPRGTSPGAQSTEAMGVTGTDMDMDTLVTTEATAAPLHPPDEIIMGTMEGEGGAGEAVEDLLAGSETDPSSPTETGMRPMMNISKLFSFRKQLHYNLYLINC